MTFWPANYESSWTLVNSVSRRGIGLHSGAESEVRLIPFDKPGFHVSWVDSKEPPIPLSLNQVRESQLCTNLLIGNNCLSTVEHLLAALAGCGVNHVHIEVSGNEIPLLDGSAIGWVEAIEEAGYCMVDEHQPNSFPLENSLIFNRGTSVIAATPAERFSLVGIIDFPYGAIGRQNFAINLTPETFVKEIAPARTFGFRDQHERLIASGLIKGGRLDNALVCDGDRWMNPPLRFEDEPVRHKLLDLIGDLAIVGFPKAQVLVYKGSHKLHADLAAALMKNCPESRLCFD